MRNLSSRDTGGGRPPPRRSVGPYFVLIQDSNTDQGHAQSNFQELIAGSDSSDVCFPMVNYVHI
jgi:hypothetical protein